MNLKAAWFSCRVEEAVRLYQKSEQYKHHYFFRVKIASVAYLHAPYCTSVYQNHHLLFCATQLLYRLIFQQIPIVGSVSRFYVETPDFFRLSMEIKVWKRYDPANPNNVLQEYEVKSSPN